MGNRLRPISFYVYKLCDPSNGLPFYVGKGSGRRAWQHEAAVRAGDTGGNSRKVAKIKDILHRGGIVSVVIFAEFDDEIDAYECEIEQIALSPTLTNLAPGGGPIRVASPQNIVRWKAAKIARLDEERRIQGLKTIDARNVRRAQVFFKVSKSDRHVEEIKSWLSGLRPVHESRGPDPSLSIKSANGPNSRERCNAPAPMLRIKRAPLSRTEKLANIARRKGIPVDSLI